MIESSSPSARSEATAFPPAGLHSLFNWLDSPPPPSATDELASLHRQLASLRASAATPEQRGLTLERLYARSMTTVNTLLASLTGSALPIPIPRNTRQLIRSLQLLLRTLAEDFLTTPNNSPSPPELRHPPLPALWRSLHALAQHLLISSLVASPAAVGIWRQLHQTYETARRLQLTDKTPDGATGTVQDIYFSAVLLGCAQPGSFTSTEVNFVADYLTRFPNAIDAIDDSAIQTPAAFWIDPEQDATAFACARKTAPPQTPVHYFCCSRLAARLKQQLAELEAGASAEQTGLPDFAGIPAGRGVMRRLANYWGEPGKRRYPRRRQNYRALLCSGLVRLWRLFQDGDQDLEKAPQEMSNWMITNESPDGYAFMHVSGKTGSLSVGDITAIRTDSGKSWQICIVRWALSENQEHLELGLQILATRAIPARLALPANDSDQRLLSVLILPAIRDLRASEMLVVPSSALENLPDRLILVIDKGSIKVREVKSTRIDEQNSKIAILSIEPDSLPG
jgi:hypothetical protein